MVLLNALAGKLQRGDRLLLAGVVRGTNFVRRDAHTDFVEIDMVELAREIDQRRIPPRLHVGNDRRDRRVDVRGDLALLAEKGRERLLEARIARLKPLRHHFAGICCRLP